MLLLFNRGLKMVNRTNRIQSIRYKRRLIFIKTYTRISYNGRINIISLQLRNLLQIRGHKKLQISFRLSYNTPSLLNPIQSFAQIAEKCRILKKFRINDISHNIRDEIHLREPYLIVLRFQYTIL